MYSTSRKVSASCLIRSEAEGSFFAESQQTHVQIVFIDVPGTGPLETVMFPVAFQSDSFKQQRLQHSILKYSHLYQFFCTDNLYPCPVFLYDVCNEVIRFPVHSKSAVEVIHYLDMLSLFYEFSTTFM